MRRRTQRAIPPGARENSTPSPKAHLKQLARISRRLQYTCGFALRRHVARVRRRCVDEFQNHQYWVVRTDDDPLAPANAFRERVRSMDGEVSASNVGSMDQHLRLTIAPRRLNLQLLSAFAVAALILAVAGIYSFICYSAISGHMK
jgi:hypothetical protein